MSKSDQRIQLLNEQQIDGLYHIPKFSIDGRENFFNLSENENLIMHKFYKSIKTQVGFVLQLGYFKATGLFFDEIKFYNHRADVQYIMQYVTGKSVKSLSGTLGYDSKRHQQDQILLLLGFSYWRNTNQTDVIQHLKFLLRTHANPIDALIELMVYFKNKKIVLPTYRNLQDLFSQCLAYEANRLDEIVSNIPVDISTQLDSIINSHDDLLVNLSIIKSDQKGFKLSHLNEAIDVITQISSIYSFTKEFLPTLDIAHNCIAYYADLAYQYKPSRVRMLGKYQQWLYVICLIHIKYQQCSDNIIESFIFHYRDITRLAKQHANCEEIKFNAQVQSNYPKIASLLRYIPSKAISPDTPYKKFLLSAYAFLPEDQYEQMADTLDGKAFDKEAAKWEFIENKSRLIASYLRPLLLHMNLKHSQQNSYLMQLVNILKIHYSKNRSPSKLKVQDDLGITVPHNIRKYLNSDENGCYNPTRFEYYVYRRLFNALDAGTLSCPDSISYKSLYDDLVSDDIVDRADEIAKHYGYPKIPVYCDERLDELEKLLHDTWIMTNSNIENGHNTGIKLQPENKTKPWILTYDANESEYNEPFFDAIDKIEITELLAFISEKTGFLEAFTHIKPRYSKQKVDQKSLLACIMADAFGFGIEKMAQICDLNLNTLESTHMNFIRESTLKAANDIVSNFTSSLPIFRVWDIEPDKILSDVDGSKFKVKRKNIKARYSKKYFGDSPGISVMSLMANHVPINARLIGCNEHESHFAFDLVYNNSSQIKIDMLTGDNHTINQINYVALDAIDIDFVPSIKNIRDAATSLYCTHDPETYKGLISPKGTINRALIKSQKREITRVLLSLILQHNTQSVIVKKLSSHKRNIRLKSALWEYNKLFKTIHVLNLINDESLRQKLRRARNRTESYHQLQRIIRKVHDGLFRGRKMIDNCVYIQASRLIANCVIAYNAILLSNVYQKMVEKYGQEKARQIMNRISPVAWQHINFTGRYKFMSKNHVTDIETVVHFLWINWNNRFDD
jgi:TnpA family transposase